MQKVKERLCFKSLKEPDEVRAFEKGKVELYDIGGTTVGRATFEPGWKWSECLKPAVKTDLCESRHLGYQLSGQLRIRTKDGAEFDFNAGDLIYLEPGHDAWVIGGEPVVVLDFQGMKEYAKLPRKAAPRRGRRH